MTPITAITDFVRAEVEKRRKARRIQEDTERGERLWAETLADYRAGKVKLLVDRFPKHENAVVVRSWHRLFLRELNNQQPKRALPAKGK